jgi:hypothetical protein
MKTSQMTSSKYLKQGDITEDTVVTIKGDVRKVNVARDDEPAEYRFTIGFEEFDKPMVLNTTNIKRLEKYLGDDTALWDGQRVTLYVDEEVSYGGNVVGGLRFKSAGKPRPRTTDDDVNRKLRAAEQDPPF